ncbi:hypothetical protein [Tunicatimonas pelagia]|uniref:hypothetical protein n=1 Tax=Tunicatimonas pelagia TaxID=931531 RepID=UPI002665E71E|nr:hypothetical protein [Tunicatimonas pelagia]WKN42822.1 hypothetical protein P0M28_27685 [Tunicatimonas pelagia]
MGFLDVLIGPVVLAIVLAIAFAVRPWFTDPLTHRYFIPALGMKIFGALAVGFIYQFYYGGGKPSGDTFNYHQNASIVLEAFSDDPAVGLQLLMANGEYTSEIFNYAVRMYWFRSPTEYFVVRIIAILGLFTLHSYAAIAILFAAISFSGVWAMYKAFYKFYPGLHRMLAWAILFVPSVVFWGSGILKDTITLGALGWATWAIVRVFFERKSVVSSSLILLFVLYTIYSIKIYIALCFLPAALLWVFMSYSSQISSTPLRLMIAPFIIGIAGAIGYYAVLKVGEGNNRYSLEKVSETAEITARYLAYVGEKQGGSVYTLGDYDFSPTGMLQKFPLAVNVTLFRPYLWEAYNPVMMLSALESLATLLITLYVFFKAGLLRSFSLIGSNPIILFCLLFAVAFSFAVGVSTYNFGSLVRYKIPMFPFYLSGLIILWHHANEARKPTSVLQDHRPESLPA